MEQYINKAALVAEIEKRIKEHHSGYLVCLKDILSFLETLKVKYVEEEPASEDLEEEARRIATRHSHITGDTYYANDAWFFKKGAQWQKGKTLSDLKKAVTGKMFQFTMNNVEARGDDPNGKTVTLEGPVTFHINNPESIIDALIAL